MKKTVIFLLISIFFLSIFSPLTAFASYNSEITNIKSEIVYVTSLDSDDVIFDRNYDKKAAPASLTKIMTALIAIENCDDLTKKYIVNQSALDTIAGTNSSTANLVAGEQLSMEQLLYCLMVPSANDAACVIAQSVCGSIKSFVDLMNKRAKELGCMGTHYSNPHGLDEDEHYSTAKDIATITKQALKYPIFEKICTTSVYTLAPTNLSEERTYTSTNFMTNPYYDDYYLSYVSGIKTGTTDNAGRCIVTRASQNGYSYLAVVMGGQNYDDSGNEINGAFSDCKRVLQWIYSNIKYKVVADTNQTVSVSEIKYCSKTDHINLVPLDEVYALVPSSLDVSSVYFELSENLYKPLKAPIKKGDVVGTATVYYAGEPVSTVNLTVEENVRYSFLVHVISLFKAAWSNLFGKIVIILLVLILLLIVAVRKLIKRRVIDISQMKYERNLKKHLK